MMKDCKKYKRQYFLPPVTCMDWAEKDYVDQAPVWCSVDLRDGKSSISDSHESEPKGRIFQTPGGNWI